MDRDRVVRAGGACVVFVATLLSVDATAATLQLDSYSHFVFEGSRQVVTLPAGIEIPVRVETVATSEWALTIDAGSLRLAPIEYPSGRAVKWRLAGPARGRLVRGEEGLSCTLHATFLARVEGNPSDIRFDVSFTTERAERRNIGLVAEPEGVRLDPASGSLQLVAAVTNPAGAATAPGQPVSVILSGRLHGLPQEVVGR